MAETTTAGTEVPAGEHGGKGAFPPFQSETFAGQVIWLVIAFALLYVLMSKIALPRVAGILENRSAKIAADLAAAKTMKAETDAAVAAHEAALAQARASAQSIAGQTRDAVTAETEAARKTLEAELANKLAIAEQHIATAKGTALAHVRSIAVDATSEIVGQLTGRQPDGEAVQHAVDAALNR